MSADSFRASLRNREKGKCGCTEWLSSRQDAVVAWTRGLAVGSDSLCQWIGNGV